MFRRKRFVHPEPDRNRSWAKLAALFAVAIFFLSSPVLPRREPPPVLNSSRISSLLFEMTNAERKRARLTPYRPMKAMDQIARFHTDHMVNERFFSHVDRQRRGVTERMQKFYPGYLGAVGENIAYYTGKTEEEVASRIMKGWMKSKGHRANILHKEFRYMGIHVTRNQKGRYYVTQNFADPVAWLKDTIPASVKSGTTRSFTFQFDGKFQPKDLDVFVHFPDRNAKFFVGNGKFYRGAGPFQPIWKGKRVFEIKIDFTYGSGPYEIRMGTGGKTHSPGIRIQAT